MVWESDGINVSIEFIEYLYFKARGEGSWLKGTELTPVLNLIALLKTLSLTTKRLPPMLFLA